MIKISFLHSLQEFLESENVREDVSLLCIDSRLKIPTNKGCNKDVLEKMYKEYIVPTPFLHTYYIINTLFRERRADYAK